MTDVDLGPHFERFVQQQLEQGLFPDASAVVRAGLELLEGEARAARLAEIRAELAARAADDHPGIPAERVIEELRSMLRARVQAGGNQG